MVMSTEFCSCRRQVHQRVKPRPLYILKDLHTLDESLIMPYHALSFILHWRCVNPQKESASLGVQRLAMHVQQCHYLDILPVACEEYLQETVC